MRVNAITIGFRQRRRSRAKSLYSMLLTKTGDGTGVSTITLTVSADMTITLGANATFYSDTGGTLNPSASFTFLTGAARTRYIKCTTGTATMTFSNTTVTHWGGIGAGLDGWVSGVNAASLGGNIAKLTALTLINIRGNNTLSGDIALLTSLTYIVVFDSNTLSGSLTALTSLTVLIIKGSNTLSGSLTALTLLTYIDIGASNTINGSIQSLISLTYISIGGFNTISGDLNPIVSDLNLCNIVGNNRMVDYTAGATWGNATITINPAVGYGYDSTEIDNMLIDMAASNTLSGKTITLKGSSAARTAASNAAVTKLETADSGYVHTANTVLTN